MARRGVNRRAKAGALGAVLAAVRGARGSRAVSGTGTAGTAGTARIVGIVAVLAVLAVAAAAVFAIVAALSLISAMTDERLDTARARDEALGQGRERVAELTTMDHDDREAGMRRWLSATTGALHAELERADPATPADGERGSAPVSATGTVLHAALSEFDADRGRATLLASVEITSTREGAEPTYTRNRYRVRLRHTDEGWKAEAFETIPVGGPA
ncbi:hypothetical protein SAXI111661_07190 [Saccharomonospora xinjiangensis]|uniref:hypothetical protein n=1 Tax=Saccharomonospora xinjiangensis TaxID=75294 RepID=UPI00107051A4|nr:hypothetical protein [Saccharomonospora xinjiangensis]QBQ59382.1 hypothetical protein EYD13_05055 [Saccharomonospora xinjiangensis]